MEMQALYTGVNSDWVWEDRRFRIKLQVPSLGIGRVPQIAELSVTIDHGGPPLPRSEGATLNPDSIVIAETDAEGRCLRSDVIFQWSQHAYGVADANTGALLIWMPPSQDTDTPRYYHLYYNTCGESFVPVMAQKLVTVDDNIMDEGQECFRISSEFLTYYYQKQAAGFSSVLDREGRDWIGYRPGGGPAGEFRGIPNMVHPEGQFHPGAEGAASRIIEQGPLKISLLSETLDGKWACRWDLFPSHARMSVLRAGHPYWFLYEGTPGGRFDVEQFEVVRSPGVWSKGEDRWTERLAGEKWVYFKEFELGRSLFVIHHDDDGSTDSYWPMNGQMTVFGFGRSGLDKSIEGLATFTFGLSELENDALEVHIRELIRRPAEVICIPECLSIDQVD
ncbi:hypothetical protein [Paenibacillus koleovorans]|uniref:hypothetical protein n=1 Tax=Paenibacillus koleovorans TaxID=121608 RepID=UPI000FDBAAC6|nr:hypothetical protein [Paenibacillus koleovorans]